MNIAIAFFAWLSWLSQLSELSNHVAITWHDILNLTVTWQSKLVIFYVAFTWLNLTWSFDCHVIYGSACCFRGVDDILPILTYIIIRSGLPQLVSECSIMEEFIHDGYAHFAIWPSVVWTVHYMLCDWWFCITNWLKMWSLTFIGMFWACHMNINQAIYSHVIVKPVSFLGCGGAVFDGLGMDFVWWILILLV